MLEPRRFPPPWTVEELDACIVVRDHNGQALSYAYFEDEPVRAFQHDAAISPSCRMLQSRRIN
jgi:hypothetical protein